MLSHFLAIHADIHLTPSPLYLSFLPHSTVSLKVNNLLKGVLTTLDPVFFKIVDVISHADDYTTEELSHILSESFGRIHKATSGLSSSLNRVRGGFLKRSRSKSLLDDNDNKLQSRGELISNEEVAETLSLLLNKVAGVVNLAQGLTGKLPVLGGILLPLFAQINGDLSLILSSVGNLLVGVVSLVRNLVSLLHSGTSRHLWADWPYHVS